MKAIIVNEMELNLVLDLAKKSESLPGGMYGAFIAGLRRRLRTQGFEADILSDALLNKDKSIKPPIAVAEELIAEWVGVAKDHTYPRDIRAIYAAKATGLECFLEMIGIKKREKDEDKTPEEIKEGSEPHPDLG